jgi:acetylornithine deacetylase
VPLDPVELLQQLIRTPSVNPMGRDVTGPEFGESRVTELLVGICERHGWPYVRGPVHPGRDNLIAIVEGDPPPRDGGQVLLWDVHQDTVSPDGMTVAPFGGDVKNGRVYGRGASDVKGPMASMLAALSRVSETRPANRPTIVIAFTANEECGFTGARAIAAAFSDRLAATPSAPDRVVEGRSGLLGDEGLSRFAAFDWVPDAAIVAEPTKFNVIVAHQGVVRWRCHTLGRSAHSSRPDLGVNAIYAMSRVVQATERFHQELSKTGPEHPLCGRPSACVSTIHGGIGVNTVPERATIEIDRRLAPDDEPLAAYEAMIAYFAKNADVGRCRIQHDPPFMMSNGLSDRNNRAIADRLVKLVRARDRDSRICGAPYGTDGAAYSAAGVPTVVFGPGSIDQGHTADEFIAIDELQLGTELFYDIACKGLH